MSRRFKRSLIGYSPKQVDEALAAQDAVIEQAASSFAAQAARLASTTAEAERGLVRIEQLELVCEQLADRVVGRERELAALTRELAVLHGEGERRLDALTLLAEELEMVRRQARGQATRIRVQALREAAELSELITEATQHPVESRARMLDAIQDAITRLGEQWEAPIGPAEGIEAPPLASDLYEGTIEVEVGPLDDFSQLVGFEDAAGAIAATSEISVKRFTARPGDARDSAERAGRVAARARGACAVRVQGARSALRPARFSTSTRSSRRRSALARVERTGAVAERAATVSAWVVAGAASAVAWPRCRRLGRPRAAGAGGAGARRRVDRVPAGAAEPVADEAEPGRALQAGEARSACGFRSGG